MPYLDITVIPVPSANQSAYLEHSRRTTQLFKEQGAIRVSECWGDDIPDGKQTDFRKAVQLKDDETVAVGWIVWPDRATRDKAWGTLMEDERMKKEEMPFDGKRMIFGGFDMLIEG